MIGSAIAFVGFLYCYMEYGDLAWSETGFDLGCGILVGIIMLCEGYALLRRN